MADTTGVKLPKFTKEMKYEEWERKMKVFLGSRRTKDGNLASVWNVENEPTDPPERLPKATTLETFKTKVKSNDRFCDLIGVTSRIADSAVDEDVLEQWAEQVELNRAEMARFQHRALTWPSDCIEVVSYIRTSCEENIDTQRAVADVPADGAADEVWKCIAALKEGYGGEAADSKTDDLLQLVFMFYTSGDTADQHVRRFAELIGRLKRPETEGGYGEAIKVDDLGKVFFQRGITPFSTFASVAETLAQLPQEKSIADLYETFKLAKKKDGAINLQPAELQAAVAQLLQGVMGATAKRGKGRYARRKHTELGGAAMGEGVMAMFGEDVQSGAKGGGGRMRAPPGSCYRCYGFGHLARDCQNEPHPHSRDAQQKKGKGDLWAGRTKNTAALATETSQESDLGGAVQQALEFCQHNALAFDDYKQRSTGKVVNCNNFSYANFELTDAEKVKYLKRPLQVKPVRSAKGQIVEWIVDSGCGGHMGPLSEVEAVVMDKRSVAGQSVLTADENSPPLPVELCGNLLGKCKAEKGHYKEVEFKCKGVRGLRKWLWSVPQAVRNKHVVHFEQESAGGSWIQLSGSAERIPIEFVNQEYFRLVVKQQNETRLSTRQMQEVNFRTHVVTAHLHHRILAETKRRNLVRNMQYYPSVEFGTDETCLTQKGQKAPFKSSEAVWRPKLVGALTRMDCKKIPKSLAKHSKIKYVLIAKDSKSRNVRRYYLRGTASLHQWVFRYRNYLSRKGHKMRHLMADGEFSTQSLEALSGTDPPFDYSFSNPHCQSQNGMAEADIKRWEKGCRCILDNAMRDKKSKVTYQLFPYASMCLEQIENATFNMEAPEQTAFEAVNGIQPDMSVWQVPLSRMWFYVYPGLRENIPFASRRAEGIFCGLDDDIRGYHVYNIATKRLITRRYEDCVFREPDEIFDYLDTIKELGKAVDSGEIELSATEQQICMDEHDPQSENLDDIAEGNEVQEDEERVHGEVHPLQDYDEITDSDSSGSDSDSSGSDSDDEVGEAHVAQMQPPDSVERTVLQANWGSMQQYMTDPEDAQRLQELPKLVVAQTGEPLEQHVTVPVQQVASKEQQRQHELVAAMNVALQECAIKFDVGMCPRSWVKALKSEQADEWRKADDVENKRMLDFEAYTEVDEATVKKAGHKIGHLLRVLRVKPDERRVRWAFDEAREGTEGDVETYASVLRLQTSRLLNLKAANKGRRVLRGDMTSAFLHVESEPFWTYFPPGHPKAELGLLMEWRKLLYGKGAAPRGLRQDVKSTLLALGFEEQGSADECLYVHHQRDIDFGCYVDDVELSAENDQLEWLKSQFAKRYEIKWLGYTTKNCPESNEKSKTYVGVRTEVDPVTKVVTQDQTQLIRKMASELGHDASKPRYAPPRDRVFRQLEEGEIVDAKFHKEYRTRVGCLMHLAMCTRMDVAYAAVYAARRLNDPVQECREYVDEALALVFSTAEDKITYHCEHELGSTLLMSSDSSLANGENGKSTGGWASLCGGGAWAWMVETLRLVVLSSTEAEYCITAGACKEIVYQKRLFKAFRLEFPQQYPILVDNMSAIAIACGPEVHFQRTKHIDMKYHYQRQLVLKGIVRIQHQATGQLFSDILTKNVGRKIHKRHRDVMFGRTPVVIESHKLPESQKAYVRRHNDELVRAQQQRNLQEQFRKAEQQDQLKSKKPTTQQAALKQVALALVALLA